MSATAIEANSVCQEDGAAASDGLVRLRLGGAITAATAPRLRKLIRGYARPGDARLLVDLEGVPAIDVCGIAALLDGLKVIEAQPGGVMMLRVNPTVRQALRKSGTITAFRFWNGQGQFEPSGVGHAVWQARHEARPEWHFEPRGSRRAAGVAVRAEALRTSRRRGQRRGETRVNSHEARPK
ncbi:MAG: STAS domain-containing protein [Candidatus Rokubacteria bacterium]|nr:STAS domain-containing protein [Candidatus Rokubacteria bacterium]